MPTTARVVADSISESGTRLVTMVLEYPRIIHSEFMTHRMFSRNASSSRAIPVEKQIERVENDPFIPSVFGKNKKGMSASEDLDINDSNYAKRYWKDAVYYATQFAGFLVKHGVHKQLANRLLEPFSHIQVVVTATEWDNFFLQRLDKNAQPEIQELAKVMKEAMGSSTPKLLKAGEWHLPFITDKDKENIHEYLMEELGTRAKERYKNFQEALIQISVARCARVSYGLNKRGWGDIEKDLALYDMLLTNNHWSPFEHQATPIVYNDHENGALEAGKPMELFKPGITHIDRNLDSWSGNFKGWIQNRQLIQQQNG